MRVKDLWVFMMVILVSFGAAVLYQNGASFKEEGPSVFEKGGRVTIIDLYAPRCPACRKVAPVLEEIEQEYAGQVTVLYCNVDEPENHRIAQQYKVRAIPTLVFLDANGEQYAKHVGYMNKEQVLKVLRRQGALWS